MQVYVERGVSRGDCLQKIVSKYGIFFTELRTRNIPAKFFGFIPEKVEVEFVISPQRSLAAGGGLWQAPLPAAAAPVSSRQPEASQKDETTLDFVERKKRVLAAAGKDPERVFREVQEEEEETGLQSRNQQIILDTLKEIQEKINTGSPPKTDHPSLSRISQMLRQNDFSERYTAAILEKAHKELSLETLEDFNAVQDRVLGWIGESIKIYRTPARPEFSPGGRIMVLIGPTGVGKTTTLAKLAAIYGIENSGRRPLSVRIITIDAFRIGAKDQIEDYGDIMEIPVSYIDNRRDLRREIDLYSEETDLILVDTIGRSPRDSVKLGEMKELLDACGSKAEIHLVLSASITTSNIEHILQQFEPFNYQAVLLTKLDETRHVGNVISALAEKEKPVSYITDGQIVPKDIRKASVVRFLINLDEFRVDREEIEKRFSSADADQFQWG